MPIIEANQIVKDYTTTKREPGLAGSLRTLFAPQRIVKRAVDNISFSLQEGELLGYIGPNGAGKSTMIKMLTGILVPTSGSITIAGLVPWQQRTQNAMNIGVVFGQRSQLWWDLPLIESFELIAKLYRMKTTDYKRNLDQFRELLALDDFINTPVRQLSLGQRMRGDLVAAMLYNPRILYLDEPTIGLDVLAKERIRQFIEHINKERKTTVLLTTHDLGDIERLCQRLLLVDRGTIVFDGSVVQLKQSFTPKRTLFAQLSPTDAARFNPTQSLNIPNTEFLRIEDGKLWLSFDPTTTQAPALIAALMGKYEISDVGFVEPELEPVIRQIYSASQDKAKEAA